MNKVNMKLMVIWSWAVIILTGFGVQAANQPEIEALLQTKMDAIRNQRQDPTSNAAIVETYGVRLIPYLEQYRNDTSDRVRWEAYTLLWLVGERSDTLTKRQEIVYKLLEGLNDEEDVVRSSIAEWLHSFKANDFSDMSKQLLHNKLSAFSGEAHTNGHLQKSIILLVGVAEMKSELPRLEKLLIDETTVDPNTGQRYWWATLSWAARKARARMGVKEDIERCIELVESESDITERITRLIRKDLQYVRQPEVVEYLREYLESEEELPPLRPKGSTEPLGRGVAFSQYAAATLAEMLVGFPVK